MIDHIAEDTTHVVYGSQGWGIGGDGEEMPNGRLLGDTTTIDACVPGARAWVAW